MTTPQTTQERDEFLWKQAKKRVGFKMHLRSYLIVNAGLWLIYLLSDGWTLSNANFRGAHFPWPLFAMIGWGIGLVSHYLSAYSTNNERSQVEREYEKLRQQGH